MLCCNGENCHVTVASTEFTVQPCQLLRMVTCTRKGASTSTAGGEGLGRSEGRSETRGASAGASRKQVRDRAYQLRRQVDFNRVRRKLADRLGGRSIGFTVGGRWETRKIRDAHASRKRETTASDGNAGINFALRRNDVRTARA